MSTTGLIQPFIGKYHAQLLRLQQWKIIIDGLNSIPCSAFYCENEQRERYAKSQLTSFPTSALLWHSLLIHNLLEEGGLISSHKGHCMDGLGMKKRCLLFIFYWSVSSFCMEGWQWQMINSRDSPASVNWAYPSYEFKGDPRFWEYWVGLHAEVQYNTVVCNPSCALVVLWIPKHKIVYDLWHMRAFLRILCNVHD